MIYRDTYHPSDQLIFRSLEEGEFDITSHRLINLRERTFSSNHKAHLHYHNTLEININHGVQGTVWIAGHEENLMDNPVLVTPPGMLHSYEFKRGGGTFDVLHISLTRLGHYMKLESFFGTGFSRLKNLSYKNGNYLPLDGIVYEMKCLDEEDILGQLQIILKILQVLFSGTLPVLQNSKTMNTIKRVINFTECNYSKRIDLDEIASVAGMSRSYFSRFFKKKTGTGYFTYLTHLRLERARELLYMGETVTECSLACGFENISYFVQLFKKHHKGISPGKFYSRR